MKNSETITQNPKYEEIPIAWLVREQRYQVRNKFDSGMVARYASAYKAEVEMPPVRVAKVDGAFILVDGWHRVAALETIGEHWVNAEIIEATKKEALGMAALANQKHGLHLKSSELRKAFKCYIRAGLHREGKKGLKSFRTIAQELGGVRSHSTIWNWMKKDFPRIFEQYGLDEEKRDSGGLRDTVGFDSFTMNARKALDSALAYFKGIKDPYDRGEVIEHIENILQEMKTGERYHMPDF